MTTFRKLSKYAACFVLHLLILSIKCSVWLTIFYHCFENRWFIAWMSLVTLLFHSFSQTLHILSSYEFFLISLLNSSNSVSHISLNGILMYSGVKNSCFRLLQDRYEENCPWYYTVIMVFLCAWFFSFHWLLGDSGVWWPMLHDT